MAEKNRKVLDAHAALRFLQKEKGHETVEEVLRRAAAGDLQLLMCEINLGEVYYTLLRALGKVTGDEIFDSFLLLPIERVGAGFGLVRSAARLKSQFPVSYADCFAAATARQYKAAIITGEPDFRQFEDEMEVEWI